MLQLTKNFFDNYVLQGKGPVLIACFESHGAVKDQLDILRYVSSKARWRIDIRLCYTKDHNWFTDQYRIVGTPTYLLFQGGKAANRLLGKTDMDGLLGFINASLVSRPPEADP